MNCQRPSKTFGKISVWTTFKDFITRFQAFTQSIEGEGRNDKVLSKGKHLFHKCIVFLLMQNLMLECRHLGFCRFKIQQQLQEACVLVHIGN
jgi:hypothetical protein